MDFTEFLINRHLLIKNAKKLKEVSAKQYNNRLENMINKKIYKGESVISESILIQINSIYANKANEYERTLKYYREYKKYLSENPIFRNEQQ